MHTTPVVVGSYGYVCPAVAAVAGWLLLGETLTWVQIAGMAVILAGIALVTGYWQPLPPSRPPERKRTHEESRCCSPRCWRSCGSSTAADGTPRIVAASRRRTDAGTDLVAEAYANHASGVQVTGEGTVSRMLGDDDDGGRHQRFILRLDSGQTLLVAHNIDLAPRIDSLRRRHRRVQRRLRVERPRRRHPLDPPRPARPT